MQNNLIKALVKKELDNEKAKQTQSKAAAAKSNADAAPYYVKQIAKIDAACGHSPQNGKAVITIFEKQVLPQLKRGLMVKSQIKKFDHLAFSLLDVDKSTKQALDNGKKINYPNADCDKVGGFTLATMIRERKLFKYVIFRTKPFLRMKKRLDLEHHNRAVLIFDFTHDIYADHQDLLQRTNENSINAYYDVNSRYGVGNQTYYHDLENYKELRHKHPVITSSSWRYWRYRHYHDDNNYYRQNLKRSQN